MCIGAGKQGLRDICSLLRVCVEQVLRSTKPNHEKTGTMRDIVDLNCIGSIRRWCDQWKVTRIQLEIAARRAGASPMDVARELGLGETGQIAIPHAVSHDPI
jgi:hypothetical protein